MLKIELEVSEANESTDCPWWAIVDPRQMMRAELHSAASMITGPFFSRETAEEHLNARRYAFGKKAQVYCFSGYSSIEYKTALRLAKLKQS